ncbi:hypothetical protein L249_8327 [Ophiocordyceps polyrhachis-furcata BCC 54312]|uniref:Uncharacterized protein n=1 Tax=Ophiocordyceps polyrhachis-furcata BCC 54312 TaxID=1330021 RepID=A0A367KZC7_9HYPO|nr:hypothetical protein L249_8327 [Ophiocordyceps polyrhachis-furcata BCC 54312]
MGAGGVIDRHHNNGQLEAELIMYIVWATWKDKEGQILIQQQGHQLSLIKIMYLKNNRVKCQIYSEEVTEVNGRLADFHSLPIPSHPIPSHPIPSHPIPSALS